MNYKEVEGIDENGNPTTFKIEIPTAKEELLKLKRDLNEHYLSDTAKDSLYQIIEKDLNEGEKAKEVLEIIINKKVNIAYFYQYISEFKGANYEDYLNLRTINGIVFAISREILTETEFNKIKELL